MIGVSLGEYVEKYLKTSVVHPRQVHAVALSARGPQRRVQTCPFVGASRHGRAESLGTVASVMTVDQPEARLVEDFHGFGLAFAGYCNACILAIAREEECHYGQAEERG